MKPAPAIISLSAASSCLLALLSCGEAPEPQERPAAGVQRGRVADPHRLAAMDPVHRLAAIVELTERHPGRTGHLCSLLERESDRTWCWRLNQRQHLRRRQQQAQDHERSAAGPGQADLTPDPALKSAYHAVEPSLGSCDPGPEQAWCLSQAAIELASRDPQGAAALCAAVESDVSRWECFFGAAEELAHRSEEERFLPAVELCLAAGQFKAPCLTHLVRRVAVSCGGAAASSASLAGLTEGARALEQALAARDARLAQEASCRYWAVVTELAFHQATELSGDAVDQLPEQAAPHVRAAVAYRLLERELAQQDLGVLTGRLAEVLERRGQELAPWPTQVRTGGGEPSWTVDRPGDEAVPATCYRANSRRALAAGEADLAICLLEAAARLRAPASEALLEQGRSHDDPLVRWTAERLLQDRVNRPGPASRPRGSAR